VIPLDWLFKSACIPVIARVVAGWPVIVAPAATVIPSLANLD